MSDASLLARQIASGDGGRPVIEHPYLRQATVASVDATNRTVGVQIAGSSTVVAGVKFLQSYWPVVGDTVWVAAIGPNLWVLGALSNLNVPPEFRVNRTTNQSINNSTDTAITWETSRTNRGSMWNSGVNPTRVTAVRKGIHVGGCQIRWATSASTGERYACVRINAVSLSRAGEQGVAPSGGVVTLDFPWEADLAVGDYLETIVFQATGGALNVTPTFTWSVSLWGVWVRDS